MTEAAHHVIMMDSETADLRVTWERTKNLCLCAATGKHFSFSGWYEALIFQRLLLHEWFRVALQIWWGLQENFIFLKNLQNMCTRFCLGKEVVCSIHRESIEVSEVLFCLTEEESKYIQHTHKEVIYTMHFCDLQESYCFFGLVW